MQRQNSKLHAWWLAARPRTLPAALAPVIVGSALAWSDGLFALLPALAAMMGALLIQIGANYANDLFDYQKGVDNAHRLGPLRVTQAGLLSEGEMMRGTGVVFALASLCGVYLIFVAGWPVAVIGLASILAALAYTGGPRPYGYSGWGEVFVFLFFGLAAVAGSYYVQARQINLAALAASFPVGFLVVNILVVNNLRDIPTDRASGKHTLAARFGEAWARREYLVILVLAYLSTGILALSGLFTPWVFLSWGSLPVAVRLARAVWRDSGRALNASLAGSGQLELLFCLLFSIGLILGKIF
ncbi:MAG TPA: 1,4-dihydroxy-2-naphthoate polyprenyltransferase [Anaerolinea thermolimosa]|uniref:1,4-dihydroxy-2-naphthoate octaprenyltransferase n=1 Tax=Anaerolinea thermolimosa TaxID=229919 RepID=A0A3D1JI78_9CHLR|nr:1,4-dihydroxy-2-naphthoate polyprenyltransferase [Anaerolinea thermolimosa]